LRKGEAFTLKVRCTTWIQQIPSMATSAAEASKFPEGIASHFVGPVESRPTKHYDEDV
jgi:hypothetical protein